MPLSVDMPLEQLKKYEGISPKPQDFDLYWSRSLEELKELPKKFRIEKNEFGDQCFFHPFTSNL